MAAPNNKPKRLPKELQDYKREIKKLPYKERVIAYFNCSPYTRDIDSQKKEIIYNSFSKSEREDYYRRYLPIHNSIERYGDRIRAINANRIIYTNYLDSETRHINTYNYTADILNLALPKIEEALEGSSEVATKEKLKEALSWLRNYRRISISAPEIKLNKEGNGYEVLTEEKDNYLLGAIQTLKGILSLLKCYLEALREFLEWVGTPELLPKEFDDMEYELKKTYKPIPFDELPENKDADKFPLFCAKSEAEKELYSIDYEALPRTINILGENNLFANTYRRFFI